MSRNKDVVHRYPYLLVCAAICLGCTSETPTSPDTRPVAASEFERLSLFVRDSPGEYVQVELTRNNGESTLTIFRPPQPGVPRVLLDSIGPSTEDPVEIVALLKTFDVWAMADSNAVGAACSTRSGWWVCNPTFNDYSLVIGAKRGGVTRAQRYTRLSESNSSTTARALGDYVFAMARKRVVSALRQ